MKKISLNLFLKNKYFYSFSLIICFFSLLFTNYALSSALKLNEQALNKISAITNKDSYSFIVTGDNRDGNDIYKELIKKASKHKPAFLINTGDFVSMATIAEYNEYVNIIKNSLFPILTVIGNHDINKQQGRQVYNQYFGECDFYFDFGKDRFIFIDNNDGLNNKQLDFLEQTLKEQKRFKFISMHKPPYTEIWLHSFSKNANKFMQIVEKYKVNYVLCGHIHAFDKLVKNNVTYVVTGGGGAPLYPLPVFHSKDAGAFYHYVLMEVSAKGIKETVIKL